MHKPSILQHYTCKSTPWVYRLVGDAQCNLVQRPSFRAVLEKVTQQVNCKTVLKFGSCGFEKQSPSSFLLIPTYFFNTLVAKLEIFEKSQTEHVFFFKAFLFFLVLLRITKYILIYFRSPSTEIFLLPLQCRWPTYKKRILKNFEEIKNFFFEERNIHKVSDIWSNVCFHFAASFLLPSYLKIKREMKKPHTFQFQKFIL